MTGAFAAGLDAAGVGPGDRVGLYLPNLPLFVVGFHGTLRAGGVVVPMNPQYKAREIRHLLSDSDARVVVCLPGLVPFVVRKPGADATPADLKRFCLDHLAEYKHPREVVFVDEPPRTTTGKVRKFELRGE